MANLKFLYPVLFPFLIYAQKRHYKLPVDSPAVITANYAELRPNHFHAGIDFSTGGNINTQVYSIDEGYVSRIRVSPYGYGKCVYITHPGNRVSVYAHLNAFSLKIGDYVKREQYAMQTFEIELLPKPYAILVRKGEIIGLSGNTGGSTGPHLHFEIRDEKSETPLNPLEYYSITDNVAPTVTHIGFYNLSDTSAPVFIRSYRTTGSADNLQIDDVELDEALFGLAFSGYDRQFGDGNHNNIFSVKVLLDNRLIYSHKLNYIDFRDNRYVNEFSEKVRGVQFQKCFLPTIFPAGMYGRHENKGRILIRDQEPHQVQMIFADEKGNEVKAGFRIKVSNPVLSTPVPDKGPDYVNCARPYRVKKDGLDLFIPAATLYYSTPIEIVNKVENGGLITITPEDAKLASLAIAGFQIPENMKRYSEKLLLKSGNQYYTPRLQGDSVYFAIKNFGRFQLVADLIPPVIRIPRTSRSRNINAGNSVSFTIYDNQSGIGKYKLLLNGKWVLAEYDAKNNLLTYYFSDSTPEGELNFHLEVEDKVGNSCGIYHKQIR